MRGTHLRQIIDPFLPAKLETRVSVLPSPRYPLMQVLWARVQPAGMIFFVTKPAIRRLLPETAYLLHCRGCRLCLDHVDSAITPMHFEPDAHIASSFAQGRDLRSLQAAGTIPPAPVFTVLHNADARLYGLTAPARPAFRAAYFGLPELTSVPPPLKAKVAVLSANGAANVARALAVLPEFALHYACRSDTGANPAIIKPFTKGVTAAIFGANVLTGSDVPDAVEMLGADYPYLTPSQSDADIAETFARAQDDFGGPDWARGLRAMHSVAKLVSPQSLALQIKKLVDELEI